MAAPASAHSPTSSRREFLRLGLAGFGGLSWPAILRLQAHTGGGHPSGSLQLLSGDPDAQDKLVPVYPDVMSVAHYLRARKATELPNYVGVNPITRYDNFTIAGPGYLGPSYEPFAVLGDP